MHCLVSDGSEKVIAIILEMFTGTYFIRGYLQLNLCLH